MNHVHVYRPREDRLLQLVFFLWKQLSPQQQEELTPDIEAAEMGWAIPSWERRDPNDWLTIEELATELGMTVAGVRNWRTRYDLRPISGRHYRWGDVEDVKRKMARRHARRAG